jgi:metal-responsive CopG/Arc/MetJ family transcriptional regulator
MEVLAVRGRAGSIRELSNRLITAKGILHGRLAVTRIE